MKISKIVLTGVFTFFFCSLFAQVIQPTGIVNRAWVKNENGVTGNVSNRKPIPYAHLREADVFFAKRVWRCIDLKEKINLPLYYPADPDSVRDRLSLTMVLWNAVVVTKELKGYTDEDMKIEQTPADIINSNAKTDTLRNQFNPRTGDNDSTVVVHEQFKAKNAMKYWLVEDWFFDKQRSVMDVRIIAMSPIVTKFIIDPNTGESVEKGLGSLFWVYFPAAREVLARYECFNRFNDAERRSYDDVFWKRMFGSYVIKEENVYDRSIADYTKGLDALLESERVKDELFIKEHDLWEY